jgi:putative membrane protein
MPNRKHPQSAPRTQAPFSSAPGAGARLPLDSANLARDGSVMAAVKGFLIGIANIIPGVSGGTFALILGVFDRIVYSLNDINGGTLEVALRLVGSGFKRDAREAFVAEWKRLDATFMVLLIVGAGVSILSVSFLIKFLLAQHYSPTLAFFIGLILPSIAIPWAMLERKGLVLLWAVPGILLTVGVSLIMPDSSAGLDNPLFAFATGAIAISAMILPGISGSYVMLVMGQYQNVLEKITSLQLSLAKGRIDFGAALWLGALAAGMGVGILLFARLLHFLLRRFRSATMAFLIGLLVGSLYVLWPFKNLDAGAGITDRKGRVKEDVRIATAPNRMPETASEGLIGGGALVAGFLCSAGLIAFGRREGDE